MTSPSESIICVCGDPVCKVDYGYCHCGCGQLTLLRHKKPQCFIRLHRAYMERGTARPVPRKIPVVYKRTCVNSDCKKPFKSTSPTKRYCSTNCKLMVMSYIRAQNPLLNNGSIGALSELRVCADLMLRGFEVFRAVSSASSCDIVAVGQTKILRVEVKTAYPLANGGIGWPKTKDFQERQLKYDVLALAMKDRVVYQPELQL